MLAALTVMTAKPMMTSKSGKAKTCLVLQVLPVQPAAHKHCPARHKPLLLHAGKHADVSLDAMATRRMVKPTPVNVTELQYAQVRALGDSGEQRLRVYLRV